MGVMDLGRMGKKELGETLVKIRGEKETLLDQLTAANEEIQRLNKELEKTRDELNNSRAIVQAKQEALDEAERKLETRALELDDAGSIAEASLRVNGVFFAAQKAADQYLESVRQLRERQEEVCARRASESKREAESLIETTREECDRRTAETDAYCAVKEEETNAACAAKLEETNAICEKKLADTEAEVEEYWKNLTGRLENFYNAHVGMRELLASFDMKVTALEQEDKAPKAEEGRREVVITEL